MFTFGQIVEIRDRQLELRNRRDPLFSEAVLQACDSVLTVQRRAGPETPPKPIDYWWTRD